MTAIVLYACVWLFGVGIGILIGDGCLERRKRRRAIMESWPSVPGRRAVRALKRRDDPPDPSDRWRGQ